MQKIFLFGFFGLTIIVMGAVITAVTATNIVPGSNLDDQQISLSANDLKPAACNSLNLINVIIGSGNFQGDNSNNLILGSSQNDSINGRQGNDCIIGGGGDDFIDGRNGYDICLGGGGNDTFSRCEEIIQ
jgi:Ca2+-binding RTX toxin-like protein